ncbi:MAG: glycosyltransferase [Bacilli bacterium]|nr:glycosyltransferase [Bacilli bacterium]
MKKVTILALHLGYGGIENAIATLANQLCTKYDVEILSVYRLYNEPVFDLDERVKINYISNIKPNKKEMLFYLKKKNYSKLFKGLGQSIKTGYVKYIKTASYLRKLDTDVIISTRTVHNFLVSRFVNKDVRKIAWEHNHHNNKNKYIKRLVSSCKKMDYFVPVSIELEEFYKKYLGKKVFYIPNGLDSIPKKASKLDNKNIISVGRLSKEKGFDDLLRVFKRLVSKDSELRLNIVGDGVEKNNLLELAKELKLGDKVVFHGYQNKEYINDLLLNSSLYVMTSHTESFGLVLIESMSYGVPCISYTSAQGANEIIDDGINGYLIEDRNEDEMIDKINLIMEDDKLRKKLGRAAKKRSLDYSSDVVLEKWSKLINKRK